MLKALLVFMPAPLRCSFDLTHLGASALSKTNFAVDEEEKSPQAG